MKFNRSKRHAIGVAVGCMVVMAAAAITHLLWGWQTEPFYYGGLLALAVDGLFLFD